MYFYLRGIYRGCLRRAWEAEFFHCELGRAALRAAAARGFREGQSGLQRGLLWAELLYSEGIERRPSIRVFLPMGLWQSFVSLWRLSPSGLGCSGG